MCPLLSVKGDKISFRIVKKYLFYWYWYILLTAIGLSPGGSSTVHIYTQTVHRTTQLTTLVGMLSGIRTQSGQTKVIVSTLYWF